MLSKKKSERERQILYDITYMYNVEKLLTHRNREPVGVCHSGRGGEGSE